MERKPTIYIVDDEPEVLESITHLVQPIGADVKTFCRSDDFLSNFHDDGPACLVLDMRLPGMSGMELQAELAERGCRTPIIMVTGHADIRMAVQAIKSGAVSFLEKPFRPQELFDEIQQSLRAAIKRWQRHDEEQAIERKLAFLKAGERTVIELVKQGKHNEEIAEELQLSVRGVESRRARAMQTLRVDSKAELLKLLGVCPTPKSKSLSQLPRGRDVADSNVITER